MALIMTDWEGICRKYTSWWSSCKLQITNCELRITNVKAKMKTKMKTKIKDDKY